MKTILTTPRPGAGEGDDAPTLSGRILGQRYQLEEPLASGSTSHVYRATDLALGRPVAVKVLRRERARDATAVRRFQHEIRTCALLRSAHTVRMHDFGVSEDGWPYAVMELLDGRSLADVLAEEGHLPASRAVAVAAQVARSLEEAHAYGIVHRDLKPANVFLTWPHGETDCARVLDFGLAQSPDDPDTLAGRKRGVMFGTPYYVAPEQALGDPLDGRADLYSLGVVLYEMVTGARPFRGDSLRAVVSRRLHEPAPPLPGNVAGQAVPEALRRLVGRLLSRDPDDRPASAADVAEELLAIDPRRSVATPAATLLFGGSNDGTVLLPGITPWPDAVSTRVIDALARGADAANVEALGAAETIDADEASGAGAAAGGRDASAAGDSGDAGLRRMTWEAVGRARVRRLAAVSLLFSAAAGTLAALIAG